MRNSAPSPFGSGPSVHCAQTYGPGAAGAFSLALRPRPAGKCRAFEDRAPVSASKQAWPTTGVMACRARLHLKGGA